MADNRLKIDGDLAAVQEIKSVGGDTLKKCYQCATCASVCPLAPDEAPFPRKQMLLAQWGAKEKLLSDPSIWLCHQCGDCTKYCPRNARPGDVLASLRILVTKELVPFKFLNTFYNNLWGLPILVLIAFVYILLVTIFAFKGMPNFFDATSFPYNPNLYYKLGFMKLPARVVMIDVVFLSLAGLVVILMVNAVSKMWKTYLDYYNVPQAYRYGVGTILANYLIPALKEILDHSRFEKCGANSWRATPHKMLLFGFIILFITTGTVFILADFLGMHTPWNPLTHPVKWLGYIGGLLLLYGVIGLMTGRNRAVLENSLKTSYSDSFLLWLILLVGVTGFAIVVFRSIPSLYNLTGLVYLIHLITVFLLFLAIPYSKFSHLVFRTTAVVFDLYYRDVLKKMGS
ncbi:MAG: quinone-interacting membrane-bound oxidoreductase complex subunit QmoC [Caldimicrobium sp.]|nr:quinone-interacting membrane-bound oxidoreductase complex subunit QmoC [Caldimicrobium sp.]MCX7874256.1 quinone-interacting membrane-bound oxidoreductase complex subunit QmoC [Caldimicrobium sp.]MDW8093937.1 quinone-interacting membrane-bound oxidoreductase complex subunit QmoC [Caldimicrobium sp.]